MKTITLIALCLLSRGFCICASDYQDVHIQAVIEEQQPQHTIDGYTLNDVGWACLQGDLEGLKKLIANGYGFKECMDDDIYVFDAMYAAIYGGQKMIVDYLIEKGENVNTFYTEDGITPLLMACTKNRMDIAKSLLRAGANANGAGDLGGDYILYPILKAVYNRNMALVKLLVRYGADVNITDKQGGSPLALAIQNEDVDMISFLKRQSIKSSSKSIKKGRGCTASGCQQ